MTFFFNINNYKAYFAIKTLIYIILFQHIYVYMVIKLFFIYYEIKLFNIWFKKKYDKPCTNSSIMNSYLSFNTGSNASNNKIHLKLIQRY